MCMPRAHASLVLNGGISRILDLLFLSAQRDIHRGFHVIFHREPSRRNRGQSHRHITKKGPTQQKLFKSGRGGFANPQAAAPPEWRSKTGFSGLVSPNVVKKAGVPSTHPSLCIFPRRSSLLTCTCLSIPFNLTLGWRPNFFFLRALLLSRPAVKKAQSDLDGTAVAG